MDGPSRRPDYARDDEVIHLDQSQTLPTYDKKLQFGASGADNPQGGTPAVGTGGREKSMAEEPLVTSDRNGRTNPAALALKGDIPLQGTPTYGNPTLRLANARGQQEDNVDVADVTAEQGVRADGSGQTSRRIAAMRAMTAAGTDGSIHLVPRIRIVWAASPQPDNINLIAREQEGDAWIASGRLELCQEKAGKEWSMGKDNLLLHKGSIVVPRDQSLRQELIRVHYDDPLSGHFGVAKTSAPLQRKYYWPKMAEDVKDFVSTCRVCQRMKAPRHKPYGFLN